MKVFRSFAIVFSLLILTSGALGQITTFEFDGKDASNLTRSPRVDPKYISSPRQGYLRLHGSSVTLDDTEVAPVMLTLSPKGERFDAMAKLDFSPKAANETAGMDVGFGPRAHYEVGVRGGSSGGREIYLRFVQGTSRTIAAARSIPTSGHVLFQISSFPTHVRFFYSVDSSPLEPLGGAIALPKTALEQKLNVGIFASNGGHENGTYADFDAFILNESPLDPYADVKLNDPSLPKGYTIFSVDAAERGIVAKYPFITRPSADVPDSIRADRGVVYARYGERDMRANLFIPKAKGKHPAVVIVHGGAWITGHYSMEDPLAIALAKRGYAAMTIEYRLSNEKKHPAQIHDLKAAVRWLRANAGTYNVDAKRIGAAGASSGGHLVALLGVTNGLKQFEGDGGSEKFSSAVGAVVDIDGTATFVDVGNIAKEIAGPYDTNTRLTGFTYAQNPDIWREASPITHVYAKSAPTLFLNSSSFRPFQQREEMAAKLRSLGIVSDIIVIPDTPHPFWLFNPWFDETVRLTDEFFKKTLGRK